MKKVCNHTRLLACAFVCSTFHSHTLRLLYVRLRERHFLETKPNQVGGSDLYENTFGTRGALCVSVSVCMSFTFLVSRFRPSRLLSENLFVTRKPGLCWFLVFVVLFLLYPMTANVYPLHALFSASVPLHQHVPLVPMSCPALRHTVGKLKPFCVHFVSYQKPILE